MIAAAAKRMGYSVTQAKALDWLAVARKDLEHARDAALLAGCLPVVERVRTALHSIEGTQRNAKRLNKPVVVCYDRDAQERKSMDEFEQRRADDEAAGELREATALNTQMARLLDDTLNVLAPLTPPGTVWSFHNLPELARIAKTDAIRWRFLRRMACASEDEQHRLAATIPLAPDTTCTPNELDAAFDTAIAADRANQP